ncbi:MAG TPA: DnaJ C-terminal domain-containing protein [Acidimicrobiia bacterium]|nr:DnaJ C-terminal domain-containing protein [Acidimicrobiia bacterium]
MPPDYYSILGVSREANGEEVKRAFRRLARETHPDANPGDPGAEARFKEVAAAYEVLSDPERRRAYDRGDTIDLSDIFGGNFSGFDDLIRSVFGDSGFFGGGSGRGGVLRGRDVLVAVEVELVTAAFGGEREVTFRTSIACDICGGDGSAPGTSVITCSTCGGTGSVRVARRGLLGTMMTVTSCSTCSGLGTTLEEPCEQCRGVGAVSGERKVLVEVPAGVPTGTRLRLGGRGEFPGRGGVPGDLQVEIRVSPHPDFSREGDHLIHIRKIGIAEAALGIKIEVPLLEGGTEALDIAPGTQPGAVFRLPGLGTSHLGRRGRGDLLVQVMVEVPTDLNAEEREALSEFARLRGERPAGRRRRGR